MRPSLKNDNFFLDLISQGHFKFSARKGLVQRTSTGKIYTRIGDNGYVAVSVKINKKKYEIGAHRLIWLRFRGKIPRMRIINHKNGIKHVNRLQNLEVATYAANSKHAHINKLQVFSKRTRNKISRSSRGELGNKAKITNKQARKIRELYSTGNYTQQKLAAMYNLHRSSIGSIIAYKTFRI